MTNWVRLWEDMPTDPKWRVVARRSGRPLSEVLSVFVFMMTNAGANATERGRLQNWSDEDVGAAIDMDGEHVTAIREAMQGKTIDGDRLTGWERRQPKREDNSSERARAWREEQKRKRTEKEESERERTQPNAEKRPETDADADADTPQESEPSPRVVGARSAPPPKPSPKEILAEVVSDQTASDLVAHRKKIRKPLTDRAARELAKSLSATGEPEGAAAMMLLNGWHGFNPDWYSNAKARAGPSRPHNGGGWASVLTELEFGNEQSHEGDGALETIHLLPERTQPGR